MHEKGSIVKGGSKDRTLKLIAGYPSGLNPQQVTLVRLSDFSARNIPTSWFQRDFLPRFQGD